MKKLSLLTLCFVFGCSSGMNSPKNVAENFTENIAKGKVEEAKKYATESTGMMIDFASGFGGLPVDPNYEFEFLKDSIVDKRAWVTFINQDKNQETLELVKIDGKWLVHMESDK